MVGDGALRSPPHAEKFTPLRFARRQTVMWHRQIEMWHMQTQSELLRIESKLLQIAMWHMQTQRWHMQTQSGPPRMTLQTVNRLSV